MAINDDPTDFMKPKTVSIRRKVRTTQVLPKRNELEVRSSHDVNNARSGVPRPTAKSAAPINPFRRAAKRLRDDDDDDKEIAGLLPDAKRDSTGDECGGNSKLIQITFNLPSANGDVSSPSELPPVPAASPLRHMPIDWCLKTKIRFSSPSQLPWTGILKTTEEASGTTGFVRALVDQQNDTSAQARFHQNCLFWQNPSLPWVTLFPRQGQKRFEGTQLVDGRFHAALQLDFRQSFKSLYHLLRARQCPFFYLCSPEFTVLFRATGVSGLGDIHALISPTTKGFRNTLKDKGIDFQMPWRSRIDNENSSTQHLDATRTEDERGDDEDGDTKDDDDFFSSLGLSQEDFPTVVADKLRKNSAFDTECGPSSCVVVMAEDSQALFTHLLNTDLSISVGSQAGIPPTLLAPVAFHGAALRSLKVRQTWFRNQEGQRHHAVEMVGPVMPHAVDAIATLLSETQKSFSMLATPTPGSTAFSRTINQVTSGSKSTVEKNDADRNDEDEKKASKEPIPEAGFGAPEAFAVEALKDCGLPKSFIERMCSTSQDHGTIIEAELREGNYYVNTCA